jgi:multidrug transporter EmrE-like cation transporter
MLKYLFLSGTIVFTVYGQLIIKSRSGKLGSPSGQAANYLFGMLTDPLVISGFFAAFVASLCWMLAVRSFPLSYVYPFMALNFVLVPFCGIVLLGESISLLQIAGIVIILAGVGVNAAGQT